MAATKPRGVCRTCRNSRARTMLDHVDQSRKRRKKLRCPENVGKLKGFKIVGYCKS